MHPEVAEPIIASMIMDYVNAGLRVGLTPDWNRFRQSQFYQKGAEKFTQEAIDKQIAKAQSAAKFPEPKEDGAPGSIIDRVIRDYVNAGLAVGLSPDWDRFRGSQFYDACVAQFSKEQVDTSIAAAKKQTDPLNKTLGELGLS